MTEEQDQAIRAAYEAICDNKRFPGLRRTLRRIGKDPTEARYMQGTYNALAHLREAGMSDKVCTACAPQGARHSHALDALLMLSHVDADVPGQLGRQFRATVQPARFRRLADADRPTALQALRHMVQQCKGRVSVVDLAWTAYRWGQDPRDGSTARSAKERLAHFYYTPAKEESK